MESAEQLAHKVSSLFSLPDAVIRINQLIDNPRARDEDLAEIILLEPALTARLLKLANSAAFGASGKIDTISRAIMVAGRERLRTLMLATSVASTFQDIPPNLVDMENFWLRSVTCATLARIIATESKIANGETAFIGGLLSGIGKLVFYTQCPDAYQQVLTLYLESAEEIAFAERAVFGFDYAELGAELLRAWRLPERLQFMVHYHLAPGARPELEGDVCAVHAASVLADAMDEASGLYECTADTLLPLDPAITERLKLNAGKTEAIVASAKLQALDMFEIICPGALAIT